MVCFIILNNTGTWSWWWFWNIIIIIWIMLWIPCYKIIVKTDWFDMKLWHWFDMVLPEFSCCYWICLRITICDFEIQLYRSDCSATRSFQPKVQKSYFTLNRQLENGDISREPKSSINLYWPQVAKFLFSGAQVICS